MNCFHDNEIIFLYDAMILLDFFFSLKLNKTNFSMFLTNKFLTGRPPEAVTYSILSVKVFLYILDWALWR